MRFIAISAVFTGIDAFYNFRIISSTSTRALRKYAKIGNETLYRINDNDIDRGMKQAEAARVPGVLMQFPVW